MITPFEQLVSRVNLEIQTAIDNIEAKAGKVPEAHLRTIVDDHLKIIKRLLEKIASIINGATPPNSQAAIDALIDAE